jgi:hypothetical protein
MLGAIDHGLHAVAAGFERLDRAAGRIARQGAGDDLARDLVDLRRASHEVKAGLAVVRTADELVGTILDTFA